MRREGRVKWALSRDSMVAVQTADSLELGNDMICVFEEILTEDKVCLEGIVLLVHFGDVFVEARRYRDEVFDVAGHEGMHRLELCDQEVDGVFCGFAFLEVLAEWRGRVVVMLKVHELRGFWRWLAEQVYRYVDELPFLCDHQPEIQGDTGGWLCSRFCGSGGRRHWDEVSGERYRRDAGYGCWIVAV